jgi:hypothetical protein
MGRIMPKKKNKETLYELTLILQGDHGWDQASIVDQLIEFCERDKQREQRAINYFKSILNYQQEEDKDE